MAQTMLVCVAESGEAGETGPAGGPSPAGWTTATATQASDCKFAVQTFLCRGREEKKHAKMGVMTWWWGDWLAGGGDVQDR